MKCTLVKCNEQISTQPVLLKKLITRCKLIGYLLETIMLRKLQPNYYQVTT